MVILLGAVVGFFNGYLVGYLRLRAFLTTLVTLIVLRAVVELLSLRYAVVAAAPLAGADANVGLFRRRHDTEPAAELRRCHHRRSFD